MAACFPNRLFVPGSCTWTTAPRGCAAARSALVSVTSRSGADGQVRWPRTSVGVRGEAVRLEQVFVNLLTNAIDAIVARHLVGGRIETEIHFDEKTSSWRISIADDGKNIDAGRYAASIRTIHKVGRQVAAFFADHDILLSRTMAAPPKPLGVLSQSNPNAQEYLGHLLQTIGFTQLMNVAGNPAMSVPLGAVIALLSLMFQ